MSSFSLDPQQLEVIQEPLDAKIFLEGIAGSGKTTAGVERLLHLMQKGIPADAILLILPQRTLATPYKDALNTPGVTAGGVVSILTLDGLAQRMVELFWPLIARQAGFSHPDDSPVFLTLETAQYCMTKLVKPLLDEGYFQSVVIDRNRLNSQILDNLNKAAVVGFDYTEIAERLTSAWSGDPAQIRVYTDAQTCATLFRKYCLEHNLLDFSLQMDVFTHYLWPNELCRKYLQNNYRHLIVDNIEEDTPVAHEILLEWLPEFDSALIIYDQGAGYRRFLGADPQSGLRFKDACPLRYLFTRSFVASDPIINLGNHLISQLSHISPPPLANLRSVIGSNTIRFQYHRFFPEMLDWVTEEIYNLIEQEGVCPAEIAVLAPFLSDALRFSLLNRLQTSHIPARTHRPSRALREESATQCLLTLAALAHPQWGICPDKFDVTNALMQAIDGLDLVRAKILTEIVYRTKGDIPTLSSFDQIIPESRERITYSIGERYERLRLWLENLGLDNRGHFELDHFLNLLFGELLSQPGFGFHNDFITGEVTANLIESIAKFRRVAMAGFDPGSAQDHADQSLTAKTTSIEYLTMVQEGVIAAQYMRSWNTRQEDAVLIEPAYTFLTSNHRVSVQFWLDVGSHSWEERLYQPLTHPYVLSRHWSDQAIWTDQDEVTARQDSLINLVSGLLHRCKSRIYLGLSELNEQGYEQRGSLLHAFQRLFQVSSQDLSAQNPG